MLSNNKKRGTFALEFTIKVIIAVICIGFLMYLGVQLYGTFERKTDLQQAEVQLDKVVRAIKKLEEGESRDVLIEGPRDWFLVSYSSGNKRLPNECNGKDCLCFCEFNLINEMESPNLLENYLFDKGINSCEQKGKCVQISADVSDVFYKQYQGTRYHLNELQMIVLKKSALDIVITKDEGKSFIERKRIDIEEELLELLIFENQKVDVEQAFKLSVNNCKGKKEINNEIYKEYNPSLAISKYLEDNRKDESFKLILLVKDKDSTFAEHKNIYFKGNPKIKYPPIKICEEDFESYLIIED